jgi:hypothetical protein
LLSDLLCVSAAKAGEDLASMSIMPAKKIANEIRSRRSTRDPVANDPTKELSKSFHLRSGNEDSGLLLAVTPGQTFEKGMSQSARSGVPR